MRTARVAFDGAIHGAVPHGSDLKLDDGRIVREDQVVWLPPIEPGTLIAVGVNYAEHRKELAGELARGKAAEDEPLVFLKTPSSLAGHRGTMRRPSGVAFMHYECELTVVIGRPAHRVRAADALAHVSGYMVANDFAVRDYLENWYRPNLRVKNRDGGTVLGPWFVSADEVPDPQALRLATRVNGQVTQQGHTGDMVHSVAALIEYLSSFMTLQPGDLILTGTPEGVVNLNVGDEVVCEVEGLGALSTRIVSDADFGIA